MRRVIAAAAILAAIAALSVLAGVMIGRETNALSALSLESEGLAARGDWEGARGAFDGMERLWRSKGLKYGMLSDHGLLREIDTELGHMGTAIKLESPDELARSAAALRRLLENMAESERLSWRLLV